MKLSRRITGALFVAALSAGCGSSTAKTTAASASDDTQHAVNETSESKTSKQELASPGAKYARFLSLRSAATERLFIDLCESSFATQAEAFVEQNRVLMRLGGGEVWRESLDKAGLTLEDARAYATENPMEFHRETALADERIAAKPQEAMKACGQRIAALPEGDMAAAEKEVSAMFEGFEPVAGPFDGLNLEVVSWLDDVDEGLKLAAAENKPVLLFFDASWCAPCKITKELFRTPEVLEIAKGRFVFVMLDVSSATDANAQVQTRFAADSLPALLILDPKGSELSRFVAKSPNLEGLLEFLKER